MVSYSKGLQFCQIKSSSFFRHLKVVASLAPIQPKQNQTSTDVLTVKVLDDLESLNHISSQMPVGESWQLQLPQLLFTGQLPESWYVLWLYIRQPLKIHLSMERWGPHLIDIYHVLCWLYTATHQNSQIFPHFITALHTRQLHVIHVNYAACCQTFAIFSSFIPIARCLYGIHPHSPVVLILILPFRTMLQLSIQDLYACAYNV